MTVADLGRREREILELQGGARRKAGSCWPRGEGTAAPERPQEQGCPQEPARCGLGLESEEYIHRRGCKCRHLGIWVGQEMGPEGLRGGGAV